MWQPCEYKEWRGELPWEFGRMVCASVWPLDGSPAVVKWVELGDEPGEEVIAHETLRWLVFQEAPDG